MKISRLQYLIARAAKRLQPNAILDSSIHRTSVIEPGCQVVNVSMGRHSFCGYHCTLLNCEIGSFCSLADQVYVGGSGHPIHYVSTSPVFLKHRDSVKEKFARHEFSNQPRTCIGHDVWIGHGAKLKAGIKVGTGAVIGMGSVVTKNVEPYSIVGGNPARLLRWRFDQKIIEGLLRSEWWLASDDELRRDGVLFTDPVAFLASRGLL